MTEEALTPDPMIEFGRLLAANLAFGGTSAELRQLADRLMTDAKAAERAGRLMGMALDRFVSRPEP